MNQQELNEVLKLHLDWLNGLPNGKQANLSGANLSGANLSEANLSYANLSGANLSEADLSRANLPAPTMVLLANWDVVSDELTTELMLYDASNHPDISRFDKWAKEDGSCPYSGLKIQRACNFNQRKDLWVNRPMKMTPYELVIALFKEKNIKF